MSGLKTPEQAKKELKDRGISVSKWSKKHGLSAAIVLGVLNGNKKGLWGDAHKAAVLLGIKDGIIDDDIGNERNRA